MELTIDVAKMKSKSGDTWDVWLMLDRNIQPLVVISNKNSPRHTYHASVFVGIGGKSDGFSISPLWDDDVPIDFGYDQWLPACIAVRNAIPLRSGQLEVRWIPNDPSLPF